MVIKMVKLTPELLQKMRDTQTRKDKALKRHSVEPCNTIKEPYKRDQSNQITPRTPNYGSKVYIYSLKKPKTMVMKEE